MQPISPTHLILSPLQFAIVCVLVNDGELFDFESVYPNDTISTLLTIVLTVLYLVLRT